MSEGRRHTVVSADGTSVGYRSLGAGEPVLVLGGALRTAADYLPFAESLAERFEVHVIDRRGRGASGPQGSEYSIERECEDAEAVRAATEASAVFGHSYGGLVALEAALRNPALSRVAVYEPGVSIEGSIPTDWLPEYARRLAAGDSRGAFAAFVRGSGHAPAIVGRLPLAYLKLILRVAIRPTQWQRMEPLLQANLTEHQEVARLDGSAARYGDMAATVLLLGGSQSPSVARRSLENLRDSIPRATLELCDGLGHNAPDEAAPARVAARVQRFLSGT